MNQKIRQNTLLVFLSIFLFFSSQIFAQDLQLEVENLDSKKGLFLQKIELALEQIESDRQEILLLKSRVEFVVKERTKVLEEINLEIPQIQYQISHKDLLSPEIIIFEYEKVSLYWRVLVDNSLEFFTKKDNFKKSPPDSLLNKIAIAPEIEGEELAKKYNVAYQTLQDEYQNYLKSRRQFIDLTKGAQSNLLLKIGKKRSDLFNVIEGEKYKGKKIEGEYFEDLLRELKLIPYRPLMFFYSKIVSYRELYQQGFSGIIEIISQILLLFFVAIVLMYGKNLLEKSSIALDSFRENFIRSSYQDSKHKNLSLILTKLVPYFSWIALIAVFNFLLMIVEYTVLPEISIILPYFIYYFVYRLIRIAVSSFLGKILYYRLSSNKYNVDLHSKIRNSSRVLGLYLLFSFWFLHLSETIVRKALVYEMVLDVFYFGLFVVLAYLASKWHEEIRENAIKSNGKIIDRLFQKYSLFLSLPLSLLIIVKFLLQKLLFFFSKNDFSKRILAQIYRKKLETVAKGVEESEESKSLPAEYIQIFEEQQSEFIQINSHPYQKVKDTINSWFCGKNKENSMVIYGENGVGKTTLLNWIDNDFSKNIPELNIVRINFKQKVTTKDALTKLIEEALKIHSSNGNIEKEIELYSKKTLVILDGCENLFLSKKDGFEAFKFFADLVNISSIDLFWVASFHRYSWNYLFNALDHSNYFRYQFRLPRWSDVEIKNLIMAKHKKSNLELVYDSLIFAMQSQNSVEELQNIQEKFFQMLWSQSRGNPKTAISLWISALRVINNKTLKITLPQSARFSDLIKLSDEQLFVLAAISKHHQLSINDIISVTNLPKGVILNVVRFGIEKGYLTDLGNRVYCLSNRWKILIANLLINKNFIYE